MRDLNKNLITAIDRDSYEPDLRGKSSINLKNLPNGHYDVFYLRIGQPIGINSRFLLVVLLFQRYYRVNFGIFKLEINRNEHYFL